MMRRQITIFMITYALAACGSGDAPAPAAEEGDGSTASAALPVPAVATGSSDADQQEVADYTLTMEDLERWQEANRNVWAFAEQNPDVAAEMEPTSGESFDEMEARFDRVPAARDAIEDAGISVRDYALVIHAIVQAGMATYLMEQQGRTAEEVAEELNINPDNIEFVKEHEALIRQIMESGQQ